MGLYLLVVAPLASGMVWAVGWLVVDRWRDRRAARLAAVQAWQWLAAREGGPWADIAVRTRKGNRREGRHSGTGTRWQAPPPRR